MDIQTAANLLISLVLVVVTLPFSATFVATLTGLLKRWIPASTLSASTLAFVVNVVLWVVYVVGLHYAVFTGDQFQSILNVLTTLLTAVAGIGTTQFGATVIYNQAAKRRVPVVGYQRSHPATGTSQG